MTRRSLLAIIMLSIVILACSIFVGGPAYPDTSIPVSTDAQKSLQADVEQAISEGAQTGTITLHITESQITSYLASKLDEQANPVVTDPQVLLRDGEMLVFGKAQSGIFTANISITTRVSLDENGQPKIEITRTDFGPLPAPQRINDSISSLVREMFTGSLGPVATGFRLDSISIADGVMVVSGHIK